MPFSHYAKVDWLIFKSLDIFDWDILFDSLKYLTLLFVKFLLSIMSSFFLDSYYTLKNNNIQYYFGKMPNEEKSLNLQKEITPKISILLFIRFLKGKSSLIIYSRWAIWNTNIEIDYFGVVLFW